MEASHIEKRTRIDPDTDCWMWQSYLNNSGYPISSERLPGTRKRRWVHVHREVLTIYEGHEWKKGEVADHYICKRKACVNPKHIRAVSRSVNEMHKFDSNNRSMAKRRLRVARKLHDDLPGRMREKVRDAS